VSGHREGGSHDPLPGPNLGLRPVDRDRGSGPCHRALDARPHGGVLRQYAQHLCSGGLLRRPALHRPDGTWREAGGAKGLWRIENGQVCNWQIEPAIIDAHHYCYPITAHKVGESWTTQDPLTGNDVVQTIEAGR